MSLVDLSALILCTIVCTIGFTVFSGVSWIAWLSGDDDDGRLAFAIFGCVALGFLALGVFLVRTIAQNGGAL
jgi:hypothetical protein